MRKLLLKNFFLVLSSGALLAFAGCDNKPTSKANKKRISFKAIEGITYTEVSRKQKNGLSFSEQGYYLAPE